MIISAPTTEQLNCLSTLAGNLANVCRQHQDKTSGSAGHELPEPRHREVAHLADYGLEEDVTGGGAPDVRGQGRLLGPVRGPGKVELSQLPCLHITQPQLQHRQVLYDLSSNCQQPLHLPCPEVRNGELLWCNFILNLLIPQSFSSKNQEWRTKGHHIHS